MEKKTTRFIFALVIGTITIVLIAAVIFIRYPKEKTDASVKTSSEISSIQPAEVTQPADEVVIMDDPAVTELTVWDINSNLIEMLDLYKQTHPEFKYKINTFSYQCTYDPPPGHQWLKEQFQNNGEDVPDIICIDMPYAKKYIGGDMSAYMASYEELGMDVDTLLAKNEIPQYIIDEGTNANGELMALPYCSFSGGFIYRRSIARDVWGTDDPEFVANKIGPGWEKFLSAAKELKAKGYGIVSSVDDVRQVVLCGSDQGWVVNGMLHIDPKREAYLDIAKELVDKGYTNTIDGNWTDSWYTDMRGAGEKPIFGYFGASWMVNYVLIDNCGGTKAGEGTYGDWAVCLPPYGYSDYNQCIMANKNTKLKKTIAEIIEWITLDSSETGVQYRLANGINLKREVGKDTVPSGVVMKSADASMDFLGGQNMFDIYLQTEQMVNSTITSEYDADIDYYWRENVNEYAKGNKTREQAIIDFKKMVNDHLGIPVE